MHGRRLAALLGAGWLAAAGVAGYRKLVEGRLVVDIGLGRTVRPLGPISVDIDAPRETVFDVIAAPYLDRTPRAIADEVEVIERGEDMVLAAHRTPVSDGLVATTLETVRFNPPETVDFRLMRGPVPHVVERFTLVDQEGSTRLDYHGEIGTDLWAAGRWWADKVAARWEATVSASFERIRQEAERRARPG